MQVPQCPEATAQFLSQALVGAKVVKVSDGLGTSGFDAGARYEARCDKGPGAADCIAGDAVDAIWGGDGVRYGATIEKVDQVRRNC